MFGNSFNLLADIIHKAWDPKDSNHSTMLACFAAENWQAPCEGEQQRQSHTNLIPCTDSHAHDAMTISELMWIMVHGSYASHQTYCNHCSKPLESQPLNHQWKWRYTYFVVCFRSMDAICLKWPQMGPGNVCCLLICTLPTFWAWWISTLRNLSF